jgi:hypothetical protein
MSVIYDFGQLFLKYIYIHTHTVYLYNTYAQHRCSLSTDPNEPTGPSLAAPNGTHRLDLTPLDAWPSSEPQGSPIQSVSSWPPPPRRRSSLRHHHWCWSGMRHPPRARCCRSCLGHRCYPNAAIVDTATQTGSTLPLPERTINGACLASHPTTSSTPI